MTWNGRKGHAGKCQHRRAVYSAFRDGFRACSLTSGPVAGASWPRSMSRAQDIGLKRRGAPGTLCARSMTIDEQLDILMGGTAVVISREELKAVSYTHLTLPTNSRV